MIGVMERATQGAVDPRRRRLVRGAAAAVSSTFIALMSHLIGGGAMPGPLGILVPLLVATSACVLLAGVRLPWLRLSGSVAASQFLFHTLFVLGAGGGGSTPATGHLHHAETFVAAGTAPMTHAGPGMWGAHLVAAVVTVLAIRHGETLAGRITGLLRRVTARLVAAVTATVPAVGPVRSLRVVAARLPVPTPVWVRGTPPRRGPPLTAVLRPLPATR